MLSFYILYYYTKILHSIFIIYIINVNVILLGTIINYFIYMFFFFMFDFLICYKLKEVGSKSPNIFSLLYIF